MSTALASVEVDKIPEILTSEAPPSRDERAEGRLSIAWLQGLQLPDIPIRWDDQIVRLLDYYRNDSRGQSLIRGLFKRANRYSHMVRLKLQKASLPEDLLYVAMVESGFDPTIESGVGAVGMWQFMEAAADDYGLERTRWVDQRMNPERSTEAAAMFFNDLYRNLGSWELALTAFNMGYGALQRAMRKYNTNDFWLLSRLESGLPFETVEYVTKVMACAVIGRNPERFGLADLEPDPPLDLGSVNIPGGIGLKRLSRIAGVTEQELSIMNPELKRDRIPPDVNTWPLRIPISKRAKFLEKWANLQPNIESHRKHLMRFGEELSDIAKMYGTTSTALRDLNKLSDEDHLGPGFQLLVPDIEPFLEDSEEQTDSLVAAIPDRTFVYENRRRIFYRVTHSDTLTEIARFFDISIDDIRHWNDIDIDAALPSGIMLQLFVPPTVDLTQALVLTPDQVRVLVVGSDEFFDFHEAQRDRVRIRYRVQPGDTLQTLAERFELSVGSLSRINRFSRYTSLEVDQVIIVYVPKEMADSVSSE